MQRSVAAGGNVPTLDARGLLALAGDLAVARDIEVEDWERLPAVHRGPDRMWALRSRIADLLESPGLTGIVVTHGTDTLEEIAYLLARTFAPALPIVVTGAMRTSSDAEWDGPRNLRDAMRVAADPESRGRGGLVVFAGRILRGVDAVKLDTFAPDAFRSVHTEQLGAVDEGAVGYARPREPRVAPLAAKGLDARVAVIPLTLGDDGTLLDLARPRFAGVVLEAFGRGNCPPGILPSVRRWLDDGKPVVLASRCLYGEVGGEYAFEGGGGQLLRLGVLAAGPRTASLARLELALCLSAGVPYGTEAR